MPICAPAAETAFLLHHVLGFAALDEAETRAILEESGKFAESVLAPLDGPGDRAGARFEDGRVTMPNGFGEAYRAYAAGGWVGIGAAEAHGGQGLPEALALAALEPVSAANMSFGLCPLLSQDAIRLLETHGTPDQQRRLLRPLVEGAWNGTMCLTESQAGSDLAAIRTRAVPDGERFRLTGQKIFITYGEHDLTANILHLVLARLPDAPAGSAGISLFAVPKFLADGGRNPVHCVSIEHKLGIRASPTCVMAFEGAAGELIGPPHRGLASMFAMMNAARLSVAIQGVAIAERAFRRAALYAAGRVQGGAAIDRHPDVRRMLWTMRALALGGRLLTLEAALAHGPRRDLLIPTAKAWASDAGVEAANLGVQVHGGMGFIEETGAAQHLRDARIAPIYEGTNGIQALTLLRRGLLRDQGAAVAEVLTGIADDAPALAEPCAALGAAAAWLRQAPAREAEAGAAAFLAAFGTLVAASLCARLLALADAPPAARSAASVFLDQLTPRVGAGCAQIMAPSDAVAGIAAIG